MSYSADLIRSICGLLEKDYAPASHEYIIENALPGTRMHPDVTVVRKASKEIQCVVEIGYTRPEKLTAYRKTLKIPDVRWYDKQGKLHADVLEKHITVSVGMVPDHEMSVYEVAGQFQCVDEECLQETVAECCSDGRAYCHKTVDALLRSEVRTTIVTDRIKAFFPSFCDACGSTWLADTEHDFCEGVVVDLESQTAREFARDYGAMTRMSWSDARRAVKNAYGIELDYTTGSFLRGADMGRRMASVVNVERRTIAPSFTTRIEHELTAALDVLHEDSPARP